MRIIDWSSDVCSSDLVAKWLEAQPEVHSVMCPALPSDPGHAIWKRDFTGICGLIGAVLHPASELAVVAMVERLELFGLGFSWGGYESLAIPVEIGRASCRERVCQYV